MKKTVLLTGGTRGIGHSIRTRLEKEGYEVFFTAQKGRNIREAVVGEPIALDLSSETSIQDFIQHWDRSIYAIINNAGICETALLGDENAMHVWNNVISVNLHAPFKLSDGLLKKLIEGGRIVNISSQLGVEGRAGYGAYCASKFAINGLTKVWAKELGMREITVNSVCPGWVETDMTMQDLSRLAKEKKISNEQMYKEICSPLELKRMNKPEEIAGLISFLLGPDGAGITGREFLLQTIWNEM